MKARERVKKRDNRKEKAKTCECAASGPSVPKRTQGCHSKPIQGQLPPPARAKKWNVALPARAKKWNATAACACREVESCRCPRVQRSGKLPPPARAKKRKDAVLTVRAKKWKAASACTCKEVESYRRLRVQRSGKLPPPSRAKKWKAAAACVCKEVERFRHPRTEDCRLLEGPALRLGGLRRRLASPEGKTSRSSLWIVSEIGEGRRRSRSGLVHPPSGCWAGERWGSQRRPRRRDLGRRRARR